MKHEAEKYIQIENMAPHPKNLQTLSMKDAG
jgi:hypothetical protein